MLPRYGIWRELSPEEKAIRDLAWKEVGKTPPPLAEPVEVEVVDKRWVGPPDSPEEFELLVAAPEIGYARVFVSPHVYTRSDDGDWIMVVKYQRPPKVSITTDDEDPRKRPLVTADEDLENFGVR